MKKNMFVVYDMDTGQVVDLVPSGVKCHGVYYACTGKHKSTTWTTRSNWPHLYKNHGWKP